MALWNILEEEEHKEKEAHLLNNTIRRKGGNLKFKLRQPMENELNLAKISLQLNENVLLLRNKLNKYLTCKVCCKMGNFEKQKANNKNFCKFYLRLGYFKYHRKNHWLYCHIPQLSAEWWKNLQEREITQI